jgi:hypothetical protein
VRQALGAALFWLAVYLLAGCAHRYNSGDNRWLKEAEQIRWDATEKKHEERVQQLDQHQARKQTGKGKAKRTLPDGTVEEFDWSWVDEAVAIASQTDRRAAATQLDTSGAADRQKDAGSNRKVASTTSWWPPLWMWALAALLTTVVWWFLRWRARRMRLK